MVWGGVDGSFQLQLRAKMILEVDLVNQRASLITHMLTDCALFCMPIAPLASIQDHEDLRKPRTDLQQEKRIGIHKIYTANCESTAYPKKNTSAGAHKHERKYSHKQQIKKYNKIPTHMHTPSTQPKTHTQRQNTNQHTAGGEPHKDTLGLGLGRDKSEDRVG